MAEAAAKPLRIEDLRTYECGLCGVTYHIARRSTAEPRKQCVRANCGRTYSTGNNGQRFLPRHPWDYR